MRDDRSGNGGSRPSKQWKRMLVTIAPKTEVIVNARYHERSDDEMRVWFDRMKKRVKP